MGYNQPPRGRYFYPAKCTHPQPHWILSSFLGYEMGINLHSPQSWASAAGSACPHPHSASSSTKRVFVNPARLVVNEASLNLFCGLSHARIPEMPLSLSVPARARCRHWGPSTARLAWPGLGETGRLDTWLWPNRRDPEGQSRCNILQTFIIRPRSEDPL